LLRSRLRRGTFGSRTGNLLVDRRRRRPPLIPVHHLSPLLALFPRIDPSICRGSRDLANARPTIGLVRPIHRRRRTQRTIVRSSDPSRRDGRSVRRSCWCLRVRTCAARTEAIDIERAATVGPPGFDAVRHLRWSIVTGAKNFNPVGTPRYPSGNGFSRSIIARLDVDAFDAAIAVLFKEPWVDAPVDDPVVH
jgi:hypothetical protein